MTQIKLNVNDEILHGLFTQNDQGVAKLLEKVLNLVLRAQATEQLKAEPYERNDARRDYRNGFYPHQLTTRVGTLTLHVPRFRNGTFSTDLFARYQRSEQALVLALMEMVVNGVSTRKVTQITEELCGTEFSKSTVSDLCKRLDPIIEAWNSRPLRDNRYPFVILDAIVLKMRDPDERVRSHAMMVATGVNEEGYREILGLMIGNSESEEGWLEFFSWLKQRGLRGVDFIVSDSHFGLVRALQESFQNVTWQRCQTHLMRNLLDSVPKSMHSEVYPRIRAIFEAPDQDTARILMERLVADYEKKLPKAMRKLEEAFEAATAVLKLPEKYRKKLRTTNSQERLNEEIRRRDRVIRIYPNQASAFRIVGALLMETHEKWTTGRKYLNMEDYWSWREHNLEVLKQEPKVHHLR